jgi:tetratricopeptide (TPR) repeat protein
MTPADPTAANPLPAVGPLQDVAGLIDASRPRGEVRLLRPGIIIWLLLAAMLVVVLPIAPATLVALELVIWGALIGLVLYFWSIVKALRAEAQLIDGVEDALALKRYADVSAQLGWAMSRPMRHDQHRLRAMVLLATLLSRLGRHEDALVVYDALTQDERVAGPSGALVKLGRAMSLLQSDHLYDADRAIVDLRRLIDRGGAEDELQQFDASAPPSPADAMSIGGLRLIELYRDVKTGHAEEAVHLFEQSLPTLTAGLGHRAGEAHALAAVAYDQLARPDDAQRCFANATALQGVADLLNRYPECRTLLTKYAPTPAPTQAV